MFCQIAVTIHSFLAWLTRCFILCVLQDLRATEITSCKGALLERVAEDRARVKLRTRIVRRIAMQSIKM